MHTHQMTDEQRTFYREGAGDALRFRRNQGDIHQTIFKAETEDHRLIVTYDDVEYGTVLSVIFKHRFDSDGNDLRVDLRCGTAAKAMARAARFLTQHPVEEPYCSVDY